MLNIRHTVPFVAALALAGCSMGSSTQGIGPTLARPNPALATASLQTPATTAPATSAAQASATARSLTDLSAFIDPAALGLLNAGDKSEASTAQFYALEIGRVGAPRRWQGSTGNAGQIVVGPDVRTNSLRCRTFTNTVTIAGRDYVRSGTACREADGHWAVVDAG